MNFVFFLLTDMDFEICSPANKAIWLFLPME